MNSGLQQDISSHVDERAGRLVEILRELVCLPSENRAPFGDEQACQEYLATQLRGLGLTPRLYLPTEVAGLQDHPLYWPGRDYANRPNLVATCPGRGDGRSLILSGHIDTVPAGSAPWTRDPFGGTIEGNRLYGRGANDMKGGVATNLFVLQMLSELGIELAGALNFETVVDEEFGGVNGTLAARLGGYRADAAILSEPTSLRVCPAQRGGRTVHITLAAPNDGVLGRSSGAGVVEQLRVLLNAVPEFAATRRASAPKHPMYASLADPVPVTVARIQTAPWGTSEPPNVPPLCRVELFWQTMPGEPVSQIDAEFDQWFNGLIESEPDTFVLRPRVEHPIRWLSGSSLSPDAPLTAEFARCAETAIGVRPAIAGIEGPCDMYVFHQFGIPALLWGASGGNTHVTDEYVDLDSLILSAKVLLAFVCRWCGVHSR